MEENDYNDYDEIEIPDGVIDKIRERIKIRDVLKEKTDKELADLLETYVWGDIPILSLPFDIVEEVLCRLEPERRDIDYYKDEEENEDNEQEDDDEREL